MKVISVEGLISKIPYKIVLVFFMLPVRIIYTDTSSVNLYKKRGNCNEKETQLNRRYFPNASFNGGNLQ